MRNRKTAFQVYLNADEREALNQLAERLGLPASMVIRQAITNAYKMCILGQPTCASGLACMWAAHHPQLLRPNDIPGQTLIKQPEPAPVPIARTKPDRKPAA